MTYARLGEKTLFAPDRPENGRKYGRLFSAFSTHAAIGYSPF